jgi:Inner centromere protein, ARK binding region
MSTVQRAISDIEAAAKDAEAEISALLDADLKWLALASSRIAVRDFEWAAVPAHKRPSNTGQLHIEQNYEGPLAVNQSFENPVHATQQSQAKRSRHGSSVRPCFRTPQAKSLQHASKASNNLENQPVSNSEVVSPPVRETGRASADHVAYANPQEAPATDILPSPPATDLNPPSQPSQTGLTVITASPARGPNSSSTGATLHLVRPATLIPPVPVFLSSKQDPPIIGQAIASESMPLRKPNPSNLIDSTQVSLLDGSLAPIAIAEAPANTCPTPRSDPNHGLIVQKSLPQSRFPVNELGEVRLSQRVSADPGASTSKPLFFTKPAKGEGPRAAPIQSSALRGRNLIAKTPGVRPPLTFQSQHAWLDKPSQSHTVIGNTPVGTPRTLPSTDPITITVAPGLGIPLGVQSVPNRLLLPNQTQHHNMQSESTGEISETGIHIGDARNSHAPDTNITNLPDKKTFDLPEEPFASPRCRLENGAPSSSSTFSGTQGAQPETVIPRSMSDKVTTSQTKVGFHAEPKEIEYKREQQCEIQGCSSPDNLPAGFVNSSGHSPSSKLSTLTEKTPRADISVKQRAQENLNGNYSEKQSDRTSRYSIDPSPVQTVENLSESGNTCSTFSSQSTMKKSSRPYIAVTKSALRSKIECRREDTAARPDSTWSRSSQATPNLSKPSPAAVATPNSSSESDLKKIVTQETVCSAREENTSSLNNLMTSITSFLPSLRPRTDDPPVQDSSFSNGGAVAGSSNPTMLPSDSAAQIAALKMKEEMRLQKQKENEEKQKRAEIKRTLLAQAERQREEERQRKEAERARKLQDAAESKKRKQIEDERRREEKRRRVEENRKRLAEHIIPDGNQQRLVPQGVANSVASKGILQVPGKSIRSAHDMSAVKAKKQGLLAIKQATPPASYEMTAIKNAAGHSSDSDDEQPRPTKKRLPTWARSAALSDMLASETRDPDTIFERVHTINLDEVFDGHKSKKFRPRTSSGVWVRDRLTAQEEVEYKKRTGLL